VRVKDWPGDDPVCGFTREGRFKRDNWRCATLNALRRICELHGPVWQNDQYYAVLPTLDASDGAPDGVLSRYPQTLWVSWYKSRGRTDALWLLYDELYPPTIPTLDEVEAIVAHYEQKHP